MEFINSTLHPRKHKFSSDFHLKGKEGAVFYTYIRKNASTSFKKLFQELYPDICSGSLPSINCMIKHAGITNLTPEEVNERFDIRIFIYRDPIERAFSTFKNKVIQQEGAKDLLGTLNRVLGRDPGLITFDDFVNEYLTLLNTEHWDRVDVHLYPQKWHLLPITYNRAIHINNINKEMRKIFSPETCDRTFSTQANSTTKSPKLISCIDPDTPVIYFRKKYESQKAFPSLSQIITEETKGKLLEIYRDDYQMINEIEKTKKKPLLLTSELPKGLDFDIPGESLKG